MKKILLTALCLLVAFVGVCSDVISGFTGDYSGFAKVLDKKELVFHSTKSPHEWNTIYRQSIATFKHGQHYKVSCDIEGLDATFDGHIIFEVKDGPKAYKRLYRDYRKGKSSYVDYFILGDDIANPTFEIWTHDGAKAIITNLKFEPSQSPATFVSMFKYGAPLELN